MRGCNSWAATISHSATTHCGMLSTQKGTVDGTSNQLGRNKSANFQSCKRVRWEFSCVTCKSSHRCKGCHNYKIFTLSSLIPNLSEELELQKPSSEEYQIQELLTWPWVVSQLKLNFFYRNMSTYCLKLPEVNISVMKFTFFVLVSTHDCAIWWCFCVSVSSTSELLIKGAPDLQDSSKYLELSLDSMPLQFHPLHQMPCSCKGVKGKP